jgi:elongation factor P
MIEREHLVATISTADFKNGMGLKIKDKIYTIVEFQHVKPGKGGAFVRYKIRDLKTGRVIDQTCNAGTKFENVQLITREMQYLYNDGTAYYFMDNETFEQIPVSDEFIGDNDKWLKENDTCQLLYADTELLGVNPPMFIEVEITETDPGFKGDTVQGGSKPAVIETGATVQVPMYLNQGEIIKVDTRDGKFVSRV